MINVYEELGETSRRQILAELRTGHKTVSDIVQVTGLKQPNVSNHLARMRSKGIVLDQKIGRQVFYRLASPDVEAVVNAVFSLRSTEAPELDWDDLADRYARSAIQGDESACAELLDIAFRAKAPVLTIYEQLLASAMRHVGTWYKLRQIDEAEEHMASAVTERMMARTMHVTGPVKKFNKTCVLGCPPECWHVIGIRMVSDYLRLEGWKTLFLGPNVPIPSFVAAVKNSRPALVLISCNTVDGQEHAIELIKQLNELRKSTSHFVIGIGGIYVNEQTAQFFDAGADFSAPSIKVFAGEYLPEIMRTGRVIRPGSEAS